MDIIATQSGKFVDPEITADGHPRASVALDSLRTLWLNTGTLCNLACDNCYIESSPKNDRLMYLSRDEVGGFLEEVRTSNLPVTEIGITGGEPFMNPDILPILGDCLAAGFNVLILTNAMRPMMKCASGLLKLHKAFGAQLTVRVSVDHFQRALHEEERGSRSWQPMLDGLRWLSDNDFHLHVAGRTRWGSDEAHLRAGFDALFKEYDIRVDATDPAALILFPEMDTEQPVPEITTKCWNLLGVDPQQLMCANSRMVVKRKGAHAPEIVACTLLPYDERFNLGQKLADALGPVPLNHPHCAKFCVLGGGACSG